MYLVFPYCVGSCTDLMNLGYTPGLYSHRQPNKSLSSSLRVLIAFCFFYSCMQSFPCLHCCDQENSIDMSRSFRGYHGLRYMAG